ncbi:polyprenyl synthetase family protein [Gracilibacillus lacisalsi]|uniref:polyprenyl synthetase family protein n=1 Tax=Gracilibacillus lacisalsi TaxID=393087 RepID=UPI0012EAA22C|nr:polyprenyl synthetase family protein [Gracilibacillus lacisalsi]
MKSHINNYLNNSAMKSIVFEFVNYKHKTEGFMFYELVIFHYKYFGGKRIDIYSVAAAIELLVLVADIYDDLEDRDNHQATWMQYPSSIVLNITSGLLVLIKNILDDVFEDRSLSEMNQLFYSTVQKIIVGQHRDLTNDIQNETDYYEVIRLKSGSLTQIACSLGTLLALNKIPSEIENYSEKIGMIAQMNNDIKSIYNWNRKSDVARKLKTIPILYMLSVGKDNLLSSYINGEITYESLLFQQEKVFNEIEDLGAIHYTNMIIQMLKNEVLEELQLLKMSSNYIDQFTKIAF